MPRTLGEFVKIILRVHLTKKALKQLEILAE